MEGADTVVDLAVGRTINAAPHYMAECGRLTKGFSFSVPATPPRLNESTSHVGFAVEFDPAFAEAWELPAPGTYSPSSYFTMIYLNASKLSRTKREKLAKRCEPSALNKLDEEEGSNVTFFQVAFEGSLHRLRHYVAGMKIRPNERYVFPLARDTRAWGTGLQLQHYMPAAMQFGVVFTEDNHQTPIDLSSKQTIFTACMVGFWSTHGFASITFVCIWVRVVLFHNKE